MGFKKEQYNTGRVGYNKNITQKCYNFTFQITKFKGLKCLYMMKNFINNNLKEVINQ